MTVFTVRKYYLEGKSDIEVSLTVRRKSVMGKPILEDKTSFFRRVK